MSTPLLYNVLFAWKCSSTHHKLALDALRHLQCPNAERWRDLFLVHVEEYLIGSKAPDDRFKDFKNHVLHVEQGFWGGAISAAQDWYGKTVAAMAAGNWKEAALSAGVLSHYYSDPWQPFHTGQTEAEGIVHRAAEWSIACAYVELQELLEAELGGYPQIAVPAGDDWLAEMIRAAATAAHQHYQPCIDHYNIEIGRKRPPEGMDQEFRRRIAVLLGSAVVGYARVLDRAIAESRATPPSSPVTLMGVLAQVTVPIFFITKKLKSAQERAVVERIYREFQASGKVIQQLPEDEATVRRLHADEVLKKPLAELDAEPAGPVGQAFVADAVREPVREPSVQTPSTESPAKTATQANTTIASPSKPQPGTLTRAAQTPSKPPAAEPARTPSRLTAADLVEKAPSIGPKTAEYLARGKVRTISDLLAAQPEDLAKQVGVRHIDAKTLRAWQAQARLVCDLPELRGHDAQLLVGCDVTTSQDLAGRDVKALANRVIAFAESSAGERILRGSAAPTVEEVAGWISAARRGDKFAA